MKIKTVLNYILLVVALTLFGWHEWKEGWAEGFKRGEEYYAFTHKYTDKQTFCKAVVPAITKCESGDKHNRWGDGGRAYGIAQFHERTFNWMRKLAGHPELQWKNEADQKWLLIWAINHGYGKHWNRCYKRAAQQYANNIIPLVLASTGTPGNLFKLEVTF
jgi:hypothetical protein